MTRKQTKPAPLATELITYLGIYEHNGEYSGTAPSLFAQVAEVTEDTATTVDGREYDLTATRQCCWHHDDFRLVTVDRFKVAEIVLPRWLSFDEYQRNTVDWKYTWGMGVDPSWPESWQRGLQHVSAKRRYSVAKLLRVKRFRSSFRRSLRDQIVAWLETPASQRQYDSPLSWKQWDCLTRYDRFEAERWEASLYRDRGTLAAGVPRAA